MISNKPPSAFYRLQFNRDFGFAAAADVIKYLYDLGISDIYSSPLLSARKGSLHGYDVTCPLSLNEELGGAEGFEMLAGKLEQSDMGLLMDIVPNHMAASCENPWWRSVLECGRHSEYAAFFDIRWCPGRPGLNNRVLVPKLGDTYGKVLENCGIALEYDEEGLWVRYSDIRLPVSPSAAARLFYQWAGEIAAMPGERPGISRLQGLYGKTGDKSPDEAAERDRCRNMAALLWELYRSDTCVSEYINGKIKEINGIKGVPESFNRLNSLLGRQWYRLAWWKTANGEINYRRFFDVTDLVSLRMEVREVFDRTHGLILKLAGEGRVTGLRIDHIDGLFNPGEYLTRLQESLSTGGRLFYVVVEKILCGDEELPDSWPVYGSTGYDFINILNSVFIDSRGLAEIDRFYTGLCGGDKFADIVYRAKKLVIKDLFGADLDSLTGRLAALADMDRYGRDLTTSELKEVIVEVTACLGVYRTYTGDFTLAGKDRERIEQAVRRSEEINPSLALACRFIKRVLTLDFPVDLTDEGRREWLDFVMRWQQFTGPVMAKGFEDTCLYRYNRLISLNEVGGSPDWQGKTVEDFHLFNRVRQRRRPLSISATSTHDTKRSEDVRARINVLTEISSLWLERVERWINWNRDLKLQVRGAYVPGPGTELFIYQTLVGVWPLSEKEKGTLGERIREYLIKACREAKEETNWVNPDGLYEEAVKKFVTRIIDPAAGNVFLWDLIKFQRITSFFGMLNSLAQVLLKIASPGVPDFYQGTEVWSLTLVDPDNRRPVDFGARKELLSQIREEEAGRETGPVEKYMDSWQDGRIKLFLIYKALNFRRNHRELFSSGEYIPLNGDGPMSGHICAFARRLGDHWALVAVPRLLAGFLVEDGRMEGVEESLAAGEFPLPEDLWGETTLVMPEDSPHRWKSVLTGEDVSAVALDEDGAAEARTICLSKVFGKIPFALLTGNAH
ncbi:MAG: malto-oligosyltrehalose synthase [Bacillota bacterium]